VLIFLYPADPANSSYPADLITLLTLLTLLQVQEITDEWESSVGDSRQNLEVLLFFVNFSNFEYLTLLPFVMFLFSLKTHAHTSKATLTNTRTSGVHRQLRLSGS
jgi:hypothetical protein